MWQCTWQHASPASSIAAAICVYSIAILCKSVPSVHLYSSDESALCIAYNQLRVY